MHPVRCCAPGEFRRSTPERELPRYFGISTDTTENTVRSQNAVSGQIPRKHEMEVTMGDVQTMRDRPKEKLRGRDRRSLNLSTKLTAVEARVIEDAATRAGKTPSEWAREALLGAAQGGSSNPLSMDIFIESVGSQMLMMAAFDPLLKASGMATEHISALFDRVQRTKLIRAQELLAKRANRRAEEARRATE
jgi:hypothetical protein